ncbi:allantoate amidohydrolase [Nocardioides sp. HDW12B]|uniref:allantoate amidohydrolase n=1 Tax=Nocardioides sp. HDW12B TaxID=2714939 RepID=UPI001408D484|nr:allantoate amidohydrolase [Nocardioides sp. HDW12B]QIK67739.1 allantoate amidohydrolase [Nocardioides sp. HDW12B]
MSATLGTTPDWEAMWGDLAPVGRASSGGYLRQPFTAAEREARAWFLQECARRDLAVEEDGFGNVVAWWRPDSCRPDQKAVLTGSHLDSVVQGGAFDGPLGVVSALAALDELRERGVEPVRALGIAVFSEEEGSRFPVACLGSRLAAGVLAWDAARELRDRDGVPYADLVPGPGHGSDLLAEVGVFVELHVEQGRDLVHREAAVGVAEGIWPHGRYRFDLTGRADHAGATAMADRRDPMTTYAHAVLAAQEAARVAGQRATFGRVQVAPNGTNAIPSAVTAWLDARAATTDLLEELVAAVRGRTADQAGRDGTGLEVTAESVTPAVAFDPVLAQRLARHLGRRRPGPQAEPLPVVPTAAGHDAGVLSTAGVPTSMVFVRNPTGVSHAPDEHAGTADCLAGVSALADTLELLLAPDAPTPDPSDPETQVSP